ncbi:MAG: hypothetical protein KGH69_01700 [Candidatus Micrarchaeota archaeon]|nr:hypothetical protein [Candidatus Micrarchaeota archaeon]
MNQSALVGIAVAVIVVIAAVYVIESSMGSSAPSTAPTTAPATTTAANAGMNGTNTTHAVMNQTNSTGYYGNYSVGFVNDSSIGMYLTNASGFALYTYNSDTQNSGMSECTGGCITAWPVFYTANLTLEQGLDISKFGTITRADGSMQTTYKGLPLYRYAGDKRADEAAGNGVGGFVAAKV